MHHLPGCSGYALVLRPAFILVLLLSACGFGSPVDPAALAQVVDYVRSQKTTGFLIVDDGRVVVEYNWPLDEAAANFRKHFVHGSAPSGALLEDVASQQKSVIAILVGIAVDKGLLEVSQPVSLYAGESWSRASPDQEKEITIRHLLEMNSGLKEDLKFEFTPGSRFFYNTPAYAVLKRVLQGASGKTVDELTRLWVTERVGMPGTSWRERPEFFSAMGNMTGLVTTPRDLARLGQLVLDGGLAADGARVISNQQLDAMLAPTATNPAYGRLWWLNGGSYGVDATAAMDRHEGPLIPAAPADLVAARGAQDRWLFVVPSLKLVVVRTGQSAPDKDFEQRLWSYLMDAIRM